MRGIFLRPKKLEEALKEEGLWSGLKEDEKNLVKNKFISEKEKLDRLSLQYEEIKDYYDLLGKYISKNESVSLKIFGPFIRILKPNYGRN